MVGPMQSSHSYQYLTIVIVMELNNFHFLTNSTEGGIRVLQAEIKVGRGGKISKQEVQHLSSEQSQVATLQLLQLITQQTTLSDNFD